MPHLDKDPLALPISVAAEPPSNGNKEAVIDDWVPLPIALQTRTLTEEEAETMRKLLDDPNQPRRAGREMPTVDASVLRHKGR